MDVFLPSAGPGGYPHGEFFIRHQREPYDLTLYQMGNQPHFHEYMYGYLFQQPGAVVFHDYCLHHSRADMLLKRNMTEEYRQELQFVYPDQAERIANAAVTFAAGDLLFFHYPLFELVVRASLAAAAHTTAAVEKLKISGAPVVRIPLLQLPSGAARTQNHLPEKTVVASFGYATQAKRISTILEAIAGLSGEHPDLCYVIVGSVEDPADLQAQIDRHRLKDRVLVTGHVDLDEFLSWMARADVIVNLRYPSAGEMSATLIQAMASVKPVIISRLLHLQDLPEEAVLRVRPDQELQDLNAALNSLLKDAAFRERISIRAKKFIEEEHSPEKVRQGYQLLIEAALQRKSTYVPPDLPLHLKSGKEILRHHLEKTSFAGTDSKLFEWLSWP